MIEIVIFLIAAYGAAVFATIAGFGSSTLLIPIAIFFIDLKTAVFLVACFHLFNNLFKVQMFFQNIDFKVFKSFGIPSIIAAFIGARLLAHAPTSDLQKYLGIFLILFVLISYYKPDFKMKKNEY